MSKIGLNYMQIFVTLFLMEMKSTFQLSLPGTDHCLAPGHETLSHDPPSTAAPSGIDSYF